MLLDTIFWLISFSFFVSSRLSDSINDAVHWALEEAIIQKAEKLLAKLEMTQDLFNDTAALRQCLPIRSQTTYVQNVHKLERTICRALLLDVDQSQLQISRDLIRRWVRILLLFQIIVISVNCIHLLESDVNCMTKIVTANHLYLVSGLCIIFLSHTSEIA